MIHFHSKFHRGYNTSRYSWDPIAVLYATGGLSQPKITSFLNVTQRLLRGANDFLSAGNSRGLGYNYVFLNGTNVWVDDDQDHGQQWLRIADGVSNETIASALDQAYLEGARPKSVG